MFSIGKGCAGYYLAFIGIWHRPTSRGQSGSASNSARPPLGLGLRRVKDDAATEMTMSMRSDFFIFSKFFWKISALTNQLFQQDSCSTVIGHERAKVRVLSDGQSWHLDLIERLNPGLLSCEISTLATRRQWFKGNMHSFGNWLELKNQLPLDWCVATP